MYIVVQYTQEAPNLEEEAGCQRRLPEEVTKAESEEHIGLAGQGREVYLRGEKERAKALRLLKIMEPLRNCK